MIPPLRAAHDESCAGRTCTIDLDTLPATFH